MRRLTAILDGRLRTFGNPLSKRQGGARLALASRLVAEGLHFALHNNPHERDSGRIRLKTASTPQCKKFSATAVPKNAHTPSWGAAQRRCGRAIGGKCFKRDGAWKLAAIRRL